MLSGHWVTYQEVWQMYRQGTEAGVSPISSHGTSVEKTSRWEAFIVRLIIYGILSMPF